MKKEFRKTLKALGFVSIIVGIFLMIMQPFSPTGAVIDISTSVSRISFFAGLVMFILGTIILLALSQLEEKRISQLEKMVGVPEFFKRVEDIEPDKNQAYLILDTSSFTNYLPSSIQNYLSRSGYENIFVPDSVLDEITNPELLSAIESNTEDLEGYHKYDGIAVKLLQNSGKYLLKKELLPYLKKEKEIKGYRETEHIRKLSRRLKEMMAKEHGIFKGNVDKVKDYAVGAMIGYLEDIQITKADTHVVSMGISLAEKGYHAIIGERDIDIREAIELYKAKNPKKAKYIDFIEPYEEIYHTSNQRRIELEKMVLS